MSFAAPGPGLGTFAPGCDIFSADFEVTNGPVTWSISAGALPTGYTVGDGFAANTGAVQGNSDDQGSFSFTIRATNAAGYGEWGTSLDMYDWEVPSIDPVLAEFGAPPAVGVPYDGASIFEAGPGDGINCNDWTIVTGALPTGLSFAVFGAVDISGTPTVGGVFNFTF